MQFIHSVFHKKPYKFSFYFNDFLIAFLYFKKQDIEEIISTLQKNAESIQVLNSNELSTINASQYIRVVSAFEMPKIKFCSHKKAFER